MLDEKTSNKNISILVVDDAQENLNLLERRLAKHGFVIETALGGQEAIDKINLLRFDLVLLDIQMPDVDGIEVLTHIRKKYSLTELPVFMLTANTDIESIEMAFKLGANDYITKPINIRAVLVRFQTQLVIIEKEKQILSLLDREKGQSELISQLIFYASDELRSPVTAIMTLIDTLKLSHCEDKKNLKKIEEQAHKLMRLIDELVAVTLTKPD